ncbi:MAG: LytR C-terminal domain-containing protein [Candidatus Uhrbacteria bacterium]
MPRKIIRRTPTATDIAPPAPVEAPKVRTSRSSILLPALVIVAVAGIGFAGWKLFPQNVNVAENAAEAPAPDQATDLAKRVSKHVLVPADESPMVATVQDPEALRVQNPVFYKEAEQGDRLLIWSDKAVLYSPTKDVVLAMLSMSAFNASSTPPTATDTKPAASNIQVETLATKEEVMVEVRNGSTTPGLARKAAEKLKADGWKNVTIADAKVKPVTTTGVFVSSKKTLGDYPATIASMFKGGVIKTLGAEPASAADILVIIGADYQP